MLGWRWKQDDGGRRGGQRSSKGLDADGDDRKAVERQRRRRRRRLGGKATQTDGLAWRAQGDGESAREGETAVAALCRQTCRESHSLAPNPRNSQPRAASSKQRAASGDGNGERLQIRRPSPASQPASLAQRDAACLLWLARSRLRVRCVRMQPEFGFRAHPTPPQPRRVNYAEGEGGDPGSDGFASLPRAHYRTLAKLQYPCVSFVT